MASSTVQFASVPTAPPDPIFDLARRCAADTHPEKLDLGIGAYRDEEGKPYVLKVVAKVDQQLAQSNLDKEYLPIDGLRSFCQQSAKLLLGSDSRALRENRVATCQTLSGTGALRVAGEFYRKFVKPGTPIYLSDPTWGNHPTLFSTCGLPIAKYRYFHKATRGVDFEGMVADLQAAPDESIVLLQLCAHNPTGADPDKDQWQQLATLMKQKRHFVLFDSAYQGYATGDLDNDAYGARLFEQEGIDFACAQSFAKNFGLYGERTGCLVFVCSTPEVATNISTQLKVIVRPMYSNPPIHGVRIVNTIFTSPTLFEEWLAEVKIMSGRIRRMRELLFEELQKNGTPGSWGHVVKQIGMFSYLGLTPEQCELLINKHHIYLLSNSRISIAGLSAKRAPYLANAIKDAVTSIPAP